MGVPLLRKYLRTKFPQAFNQKPGQADFVYIALFDLNSMIHEETAKITETGVVMKIDKFSKQIATNVMKRVLRAISSYKRTLKVLYLAVDGVPPFAKIINQRFSRYRMAAEIPNDGGFDKIHISPGTEFMALFDYYFTEEIKKVANDRRTKTPPLIEYSSYRESGEGEHKVFKVLRQGQFEQYAHDNLTSSIVVYGNDADILFLAMLNDSQNVFIQTEEERETRRGTQLFDRFVMIKTLREDVAQSIGMGRQESVAVADLLAMSALLGNDFIPESPYVYNFEGLMDDLVEIRKQLGVPLTDSAGQLDLPNIKLFFEEVQKIEENLFRKKYEADSSFKKEKTDRDPESFTLLLDSFKSGRVAGTSVAEFDQDKFEIDWYREAMGLLREGAEPTEQDIINMVSDYLTSMQFVLSYYQFGDFDPSGNQEGISQNWYYPWYRAPLLEDLVKYFPKELSSKWSQKYASQKRLPQVHILAQLTCIIPPSRSQLLPQAVQSFMPRKNSDSPLGYLFPQESSVMMSKEGFVTAFRDVVFVPLPDPGYVTQVLMDLLPADLLNHSWYKSSGSYVNIKRKELKGFTPRLQKELLEAQNRTSQVLAVGAGTTRALPPSQIPSKSRQRYYKNLISAPQPEPEYVAFRGRGGRGRGRGRGRGGSTRGRGREGRGGRGGRGRGRGGSTRGRGRGGSTRGRGRGGSTRGTRPKVIQPTPSSVRSISIAPGSSKEPTDPKDPTDPKEKEGGYVQKKANLGGYLTKYKRFGKLLELEDPNYFDEIETWADFGGGSGQFAEVVSEQFEGDIDITVVDVYEPDLFPEPQKKGIKYEQIKNNETSLPEESQNIVSALMTIHHVEGITSWLQEVFRVLQPGGYFFIREHDVKKNDQETVQYLEEVHERYDQEAGIAHSSGATTYYSSVGLRKLITGAGFEHLKSITPGVRNNPQKIYHSLFRKPLE